MKIIRDSNENEMILSFLQGELESDRFSEKLNDILVKLQLTKDIIINANICDDKENEDRKNILAEFRGYGKNLKLFENFPNIEEYKYALMTYEDLSFIKYMNYSYWNELSLNTSSPLVAVKAISDGVEPYGVSNKPFLSGLSEYKNGKKFRPVILLTSDYGRFIALEGHSRITIYALAGKLNENFECYILKCNENQLKIWNGD